MFDDTRGITIKEDYVHNLPVLTDALDLAFDAYLFRIKSKHLSRAQLMGVGVYDAVELPRNRDEDGTWYGQQETKHTYTDGNKTIERTYVWSDGGHYDDGKWGYAYLSSVTTVVSEGSIQHIYDAFLAYDYDFDNERHVLRGMQCGQHLIVQHPEPAPLLPARRAPRYVPRPIIEDDDDLPF